MSLSERQVAWITLASLAALFFLLPLTDARSIRLIAGSTFFLPGFCLADRFPGSMPSVALAAVTLISVRFANPFKVGFLIFAGLIIWTLGISDEFAGRSLRAGFDGTLHCEPPTPGNFTGFEAFYTFVASKFLQIMFVAAVAHFIASVPRSMKNRKETA